MACVTLNKFVLVFLKPFNIADRIQNLKVDGISLKSLVLKRKQGMSLAHVSFHTGHYTESYVHIC